MHRTLKLIFVATLLFAGVQLNASAQSTAAVNDAAALVGLEHVKGLFLVNLASPKKTAVYLDVILGSRTRMIEQGVSPQMVVVFIGETVKFLSTRPGVELEVEFEDELNSIAASVKELAGQGVRLEVCAVATGILGVDNDTILPETKVVGDGFVSAIGWQSKGYKLVPVM